MSKTPYDLISPGRLTSFSDGVFAIAVTLLVFNLKIPKIPDADVHRLLPGAILDMLSQFVTYVISFLLIAVFWTIHHRMLSMIDRQHDILYLFHVHGSGIVVADVAICN